MNIRVQGSHPCSVVTGSPGVPAKPCHITVLGRELRKVGRRPVQERSADGRHVTDVVAQDLHRRTTALSLFGVLGQDKYAAGIWLHTPATLQGDRLWDKSGGRIGEFCP